MTNQIEDPFAGADEDDEFDTPQTTYLKLEHLQDRLLIIDVIKLGTKQGEGEYAYAECNVVVVDGDPIEPLLPTVPGAVMAMHISGTYTYPNLEQHFRTKPGKPFLCRPDGVVNKRKQVVMGFRKHEITDADKAAARTPWRKYKSEVPF